MIKAGTLPADNMLAKTDEVIKLGSANATIKDGNKIDLAGKSESGVIDGKYTPTEVTVRIWIEGQSKSCVTKNANQKFKFNLVFDAVNSIGIDYTLGFSDSITRIHKFICTLVMLLEEDMKGADMKKNKNLILSSFLCLQFH